MKNRALFSIVLTCLTSSAVAQGVTAPPLRGLSDPPQTEARYVTFDWAAQAIVSNEVRSLTPGAEATGDSCFDNSWGTNGVWSLFDDLYDEIVDWGVKSCGQTGVVTEFTFGYRTVALGPEYGGPGAAMSWALYQGTDGFGSLGGEIARYDFTGLPGTFDPQFASGFIFVTVDLSEAPLVLPDGNLGWSYMRTDGASGPLLVLAPKANLGIRDAVDVYRPGPATAGNYVGTFNWGPGTYCGSFYFQLGEDAGDITGWSTIVNGTGVNPMVLSEITPPLVGTSWITALDTTAWPTAPSTFVALSYAAIPPVMTNWGEVLIDATVPGTILDIGYSLHAIDVPLLPGLAGLELHAQGGVFLGGGSIALTNGIDLTLGW